MIVWTLRSIPTVAGQEVGTGLPVLPTPLWLPLLSLLLRRARGHGGWVWHHRGVRGRGLGPVALGEGLHDPELRLHIKVTVQGVLRGRGRGAYANLSLSLSQHVMKHLGRERERISKRRDNRGRKERERKRMVQEKGRKKRDSNRKTLMLLTSSDPSSSC